jgi:hypothetical protein
MCNSLMDRVPDNQIDISLTHPIFAVAEQPPTSTTSKSSCSNRYSMSSSDEARSAALSSGSSGPVALAPSAHPISALT